MSSPKRRASQENAGEPLDQAAAVPLKAALPGMIAVGIVDLLAVVGYWDLVPGRGTVHTAVLLAIPWAALVATGGSLAAFGYHRGRFLLHLGWGVVAGGIWRLASMLVNIAALGTSAPGAGQWAWISAIVWVPFLEETFFRGYLGRSLAANLGPWQGIFAQAVLFTLQPYHIGQGWPGLVGVFGFGLLAGWLVQRRGSIWAAWGAHAFANAVVLPVVGFA